MLTFPAETQSYNATTWTDNITGTASDVGGAVVDQVEVSIQRLSDNKYWSGSAFDRDAEAFQTTTGTSSWTLAFADSNLTDGVQYTVRAHASDTAGNEESTAMATFTFDTTDPLLSSFTRQTPATSPTNADTLIFRATFDEDVNNVNAADFLVTGTTATISNITTVDGRTYDITVTGGNLAGLNATVGLDLAGGQDITDLAGNALPNTDPTTDETYVLVNLDFGDAPTKSQSGFANSYPTALSNNGARHFIGSLFLGQFVDTELDGQPDPAAGQGLLGGDDNNGEADEDGVLAISSVVASGTAATNSSFAVVVSEAGFLDGWIDFNQNGDWDGVGEQIFHAVDVAAGLNLLSLMVPAGTTPGNTGARFRLSLAGGLAPTGVAPDGEVEDYIVTILDGDAVGGAEVDIDPSVPGTLDVVADGNDVVVRSGTIELFRAPGSSLSRLDISGTDGDDTLNVANLEPMFDGLTGGHGGAGDDTLRLTGSGQDLDLTQITDAFIQGIETIDIAGTGDNTLTLDVDKVLGMSNTSDNLFVLSNLGDTVAMGGGWSLTGVVVEESVFFRVLEQSGARLFLNGPANWQNPVNRLDVNNDGLVTPVGDILPLINETNQRRIISSTGVLPEQPVEPNVPVPYYDVNGDGNLTPVGDILVQINFINSQSDQEGESRFALVDTALPVEILVASVIHGRDAAPDGNPSRDAVPSESLIDADTQSVPYFMIRIDFSPQRVPEHAVIDRLVAADLEDLLSIESDLESLLDDLFGAFE